MPEINYQNSNEFGRLKITHTTKKSRFMFLGNQYSLSVFRNAKGIKTYINDSHLFINLVEDKFGRLFYHSWFEEMNFGGGPDYLEESFSFAKDEEEADRMYKGKVTMYSRLGFIPLVCWSEEDFVLVIEKVEESD